MIARLQRRRESILRSYLLGLISREAARKIIAVINRRIEKEANRLSQGREGIKMGR